MTLSDDFSILEDYIPLDKDKHPQCCDYCKWLVKEPAQWGFEPFCFGRGNHIQGHRIPMKAWIWIMSYGCATCQKNVNNELKLTYKAEDK